MAFRSSAFTGTWKYVSSVTTQNDAKNMVVVECYSARTFLKITQFNRIQKPNHDQITVSNFETELFGQEKCLKIMRHAIHSMNC